MELFAHHTYIHFELVNSCGYNKLFILYGLRPNSPAPLMDDWKVTDNSSVNFHDLFFFIYCYNLAKNEQKHVMEIYG